MTEYRTVHLCDSEQKRRKKEHNNKLRKERLAKVRKQASKLAEKTRNAYRAAEKQVEENFTNNLKTLWEQDRERRKQQLEEEIAEQNKLIGQAHNAAEEFRIDLEQKCEEAKEEWGEQNEREKMRTREAYGRIQRLNQEWEEKAEARRELRRKTKEFVMKNESRMKAKREKLLGGFAHFIVSNPHAFGDVTLKPYHTTDMKEAVDRSVNPRVIRHEAPPRVHVPEVEEVPEVDEEAKVIEQRKKALERGRRAMKKLKEQKQKLQEQAKIEAEQIEMRKKQLEEEIEQEKNHLNELNEITAFQKEILDKRKKDKKSRLQFHRQKKRAKSKQSDEIQRRYREWRKSRPRTK